VPKLGYIAAYAKQAVDNKLIEHKEYIARYGIDMPEVTEWTWNGNKTRKRGAKRSK
jgi:xylulose-5-phosphate/fructose-6-phosphate phosphoketolase